MNFRIVGHSTFIIHLTVKQAYNLDNMQESVQLQEIYCVSEMGFKQFR